MDEALKAIAPTAAGAIFFLSAGLVAFLVKLGAVVVALVQAIRKRGNVRLFCLMILASFVLEASSVAVSVAAPDASAASHVVTSRPYLSSLALLAVEAFYLVSVIGGISRKRWSAFLFAVYVAADLLSEVVSFTPVTSVWQDISTSLFLVIQGATLSFLAFKLCAEPDSAQAAIPDVF